MREFSSGATRDHGDKPDPEAYWSPLVIEAFNDYMFRHQIQPDGKKREGDNWQKGFGEGQEHYNVCMKSAHRHFMDWWKEHRGLQSREGLDAALAGLLFNVMAYWHMRLIDRLDTEENT